MANRGRRLAAIVLLACISMLGSQAAFGGSAKAPVSITGEEALPNPPKAQPVPALGGWGSARNKLLSQQILHDHSWLWRHGVKLREWAPDPLSGKLKVSLVKYSAAARRALLARYGDAIEVSTQTLGRQVLLAANRSNDSPPFSGGDLIRTPIDYCTSAATIIGNGTNPPVTYSLTAGHCVNGVGDTITTGNNWTMGHVVNRRYGNNSLDAARIDAYRGSSNYSTSIWNGGQAPGLGDGTGDSNPGDYIEDGSSFPQPFAGVTNDSAWTGEINGIPIIAVNATDCLSSNFCVIDLTQTFKGDNYEDCESGDSGGPWIQREDGTGLVKVVGITEIGAGPVGGTDGYNDCFYEQIGNILSAFQSYVPTYSQIRKLDLPRYHSYDMYDRGTQRGK